MHPTRTLAFVALSALLGTSALAASKMDVTVEQIGGNKPIPKKFALCQSTKDGKSKGGDNIRPQIEWIGAPSNTKSFTIIVHDPDVPQDFSKAGKDGMVIAANAPRKDFYHWGLADIPADKKMVRRGKSSAVIGFGIPLVNDLGNYMPDAKNYGGPCPPWNDERLHHYHFTVYALGVESLKLEPDASVRDAVDALKNNKNILAVGEAVGTYTLNTKLDAAKTEPAKTEAK